jgi:hypothetical protein
MEINKKGPRYTPQCGQTIVSNPQVKQPFTFNQIYSMIPPHKLAEFLYEITTGEAEWGVDRRGGEREREQQIKGVREGELDRDVIGVSQKWPLESLAW